MKKGKDSGESFREAEIAQARNDNGCAGKRKGIGVFGGVSAELYIGM